MKSRLTLALVTLALLLAWPAMAQDYRFSVDENRSDVLIRDDGGIDIEYVLTFTCAPGAHPIDIVDVGLPSSKYQMSSVRAWIDGVQVSDIRRSEYLAVGVEVHLGEHTIPPGQSGTLQLTATNPGMTFPDEDPNYASVEFYPTYYGAQYTEGSTRLQAAFHFPAGAGSSQVKWRYREFDNTGVDEQGRLVYIWRDESASPSRQYKFGVSFPRTLVSKVSKAPAARSTSPRPETSILDALAGLMVLILFMLLFLGPVIALIVVFWVLGRQRRMKYFPPLAKVEGVEIKRGLTAPEAAVALELPLDRVFAMIVFGLVRKGIIEVLPGPRFRVVAPPREALHPYEAELMGKIRPDGTLTTKEIKPVMVNLIKTVHAKLKNFNLARTREYYRRIVSIAWCEVENAKTVADLTMQLDAQMEWVMADKDMPTRLKTVMTGRWVAPPWWWARYHGPAHHSGQPMPMAGGQPGLSGVDFADAVASKIEGMADRAISSLTSLTSDVTQVTNPPPVRTYSGGGGGGCACACAGCACACAGGGR
jgi:hypothetical protein